MAESMAEYEVGKADVAEAEMEMEREVAFVPQRSFDPRPHITNIKGQNYLGVAPRIAWFRSDFPEGKIEQEHVILDHERAVFRTRATAIREGKVLGVAEAYGSCRANEFGSYVEKASTKATGRALAALGYGTIESMDYGDESDDISQLADTPVQRQPTPMPQNRQQAAPRQQNRPTGQGGGDRPAQGGSGPSRGNPPSDKQWGLFNKLVEKYDLNGAIVAKDAAGYDLANLNSAGMSKAIDALVKIDEGQMEVPANWHARDENAAMPQQQNMAPRNFRGNQQNDPRANWKRNIERANTDDALDRVYEGMTQAGLGDDKELLNLMNQRSAQIRGGA